MATQRSVRIPQYSQRSVPQGVAQPNVRGDGRTGLESIAEGVAAVGGGMRDIARAQEAQAEADAAIIRLKESQAEDQARVRVAHRLAQSRVEAETQLRTMRANAENGAAGLTQQYEEWFTEHEAEVRAELGQDTWAQQILAENWMPFRAEALDQAAQAELDEGRRFSVDRTSESVRIAASAVLANPDSFGSVVAEQRRLIEGLRDIYPHERRQLVEALETDAAASAVVGLINRDPYAARRMLQNPPNLRPLVRNTDGSVSTERTVTVEADGRFYNIPTIVNGEDVGEERALEMWRAGQNNPVGGSFSTQSMAEAFARDRSERAGGAIVNSPLSYLSADRIDALLNRADAEIDRREARARSELGGLIEEQSAFLENGLPVANPVSVEQVRAAFGDRRARAWEIELASSEQHSGLGTLTNAQLAEVVAAPRLGGDASADEILNREARRTAAARILTRRQDPAAYLLQQGVSGADGLSSAFSAALTAEPQQSDQAWRSFEGLLRQRASAAQEGASRYGIDQRILTEEEADYVGRAVNSMPAQGREAFFQRMRRALQIRRPRHAPIDSPHYRSLVTQIMGSSPTTAYAGYIYGLGRSEQRGDALSSERDARLILRGEDILRRMDSTGVTTSGSGEASAGSRRQTSAVVMPPENDLREAWENITGDAYTLVPEAGEAAYQVFRAHYAGSLEEAGNTSGNPDRTLYRRSARVASGGVADWNGREVVMPWGYTEDRFEEALERAWPTLVQAHPELADSRPQDFEFTVLSGGRYGLLIGGSPIQDARTGAPVELQLGAQ